MQTLDAVSNSPNPSRVYIRLCKHGKRFLLLKYNTMVLPLFNYSAVVWESCGQGSKSYLDKLNRRAACIIEGRADKSDELSTIIWLAPFANFRLI